ncbi:hypothetical protein GA0116948_1026 [Chitinophaga costaii]|uniref:Uncharacterized protein n=1 Tax=Chitinophaga costaii TaxID=1335309 RepID=A0A1C4A7X3_9BACT|nr:hypothetical protein [Chitinophaga costaii]PUZ26494.1 hypothetical protein DCM91_08730 [Chitinophaga costaii]SCB90623.1 hypothetical protein GA0116948_1026 [Chitinophaga costaii]
MKSKIIAGAVLALLATTVPAMAQHRKIAMAAHPSATVLTADPGDLLSTIEFQVQAEGDEAKVFAKGIIPWVNLAQAASDLHKLLNAGEIVLPYTSVTVVTTFPQAASFVLKTSAAGFSRVDLIRALRENINKLPSVQADTSLNLSMADVYETESGQIILKLEVAS